VGARRRLGTCLFRNQRRKRDGRRGTDLHQRRTHRRVESAKNRQEYIQSDIDEFKKRFADGIVRKEEPLELPKAKTKVPVVYFESNNPKHNAFEQVVYIEEQNRVLTLVLGAKDRGAFDKTLPLFRDFARS
jgi:hypothetical protein